MTKLELIVPHACGLYCPQGDFFVDPWHPVERAIVTHAHSDHARPGCTSYLASKSGQHVMRIRLGPEANIHAAEFGDETLINGVKVSLHPAGHMLGSAQVRIEHRGQVAVVSGDYNTSANGTCRSFEPLRCNLFITESTFGLPIFRWPETSTIFAEINHWWRTNQQRGKASILFAYAAGKAQRILAGIDPSIGRIFTHGAVKQICDAYRISGVSMPETQLATDADSKTDWSRALIVAPPSAQTSPWLRRFRKMSTAMASGWMQVRGLRRRRAIDRGWVLSDHADWEGLISTIQATRAERVFVTHGNVMPLVRYLREQGMDAMPLRTKYRGEPMAEGTERQADS